MRGKEKVFPAGPQHTWAGLTKREWIATQVLAARLSNPNLYEPDLVSVVRLADKLIELCDEMGKPE